MHCHLKNLEGFTKTGTAIKLLCSFKLLVRLLQGIIPKHYGATIKFQLFSQSIGFDKKKNNNNTTNSCCCATQQLSA